MSNSLTVLGIESSCDDTAAAVVTGDRRILSSVVADQAVLHAAFGGVVPEIAARAHTEKLDFAVEAALAKAGMALDDIDAVAVTAGPGLIGGILSGVMLARGIAAGTGKPLVAVNHLAGHALTPRLTDDLAFPFLVLLVSGGHCQFLIVESATQYRRLGGTIDDAPGEAFDKTARLIGLGQPGGPAIENAASDGEASRFAFPRPLLNRDGMDLSFSGLKTAVLRARNDLVAKNGGLTARDQSDIAAGFQSSVADVLTEKSRRAIAVYLDENPSEPAMAVAGGVAANQVIRERLSALCDTSGVRFVAPDLRLCTDNAAMIAWAGIELIRAGQEPDTTFAARPRWPLDERAPALLGHGKRGAKA